MYGVELYRDVRLTVVEEGLSERDAAGGFSIITLRKCLRFRSTAEAFLERPGANVTLRFYPGVALLS